MATPKSRQSFEELYRALEEKVALLEQGGLSLDDTLSTYEAAVGLAQRCQQLLDQAELRITRLKESIAVGDETTYGFDDDPEGEDGSLEAETR
jgi:exodeoxyribonuclease VII small subunit